MSEYHKINSLFKRDPKTHKIIESEFSQPEFNYLWMNAWCLTEKIDGTNIRVIISFDGSVEFRGKTDNAHIPAKLIEQLNLLFEDKEKNRSIFPPSFSEDKKVIIYGEGYGAGIQRGGVYSPNQDLIVFDVKFSNWWAPRSEVEEVCSKLFLKIVPIYMPLGTLSDAVCIVKSKPRSIVGNCFIEGLVCRPTVELRNNNGHRIITKIKCVDFE